MRLSDQANRDLVEHARERLLQSLQGPALQCAGVDWKDARYDERVKVDDFHVRQFLGCELSAAVSTEFDPQLFKTAPTVARDSGNVADALALPVEAVRRRLRRLVSQQRAGEDPWELQCLGDHASADAYAALGAHAAARLGRLGRLAAREGMPVTRSSAHLITWSYPGRGLRLGCRVELEAHRRDPERRQVIAWLSSAPAAGERRAYASFVATVATAASVDASPASVGLLSAASGELHVVPVEEHLVDDGAQLAARVAGARVAGTAEATPGPSCSRCDHRSDCPAGEGWLASPAPAAGGLPLYDPTGRAVAG